MAWKRWRDAATTVALRLLRYVPRPIFRRATRLWFPTFTVGVVCVLLDERLQLLLVRNPYNRGWTVPGGFLGRGEQPAAAALRELGEELGGEGIELLDVGADVRRGRRQVDFVYLAKLDDAAAARLAPRSPEIAELRWFPLDALPDLHRDAAGFLARLRTELTDARRFDTELAPADLEVLRWWASTR